MAAWSESDRNRMRAALAEAEVAAEAGEVPVGAVVVAGGEIVVAIGVEIGQRHRASRRPSGLRKTIN